MELNDNAKQTYIQLLIDSLRKKQVILNELMQVTTKQQEIINSDDFEEDEFLKTITLKEEQIKSLDELDRGFEMVYDRVREELNENRMEYVSQITSLKELVTAITDLSVKLQALEKRNRPKLEALLANKRKSIKSSRLSNETVTNYYRNMTSKPESQSYFYDKKK
ncbi:MAG: flagellar protein FlgN [Clostridiales bacterium]|jgi:flagellar biosynthesis/type III secretory pathway chaperone|nr:flagellar protein FlgN [Clostridiales bacterium]